MKIRLTVMTENDISEIGREEEIKEKAVRAWETLFALLSLQADKGEKITLEKLDLVKEGADG